MQWIYFAVQVLSLIMREPVILYSGFLCELHRTFDRRLESNYFFWLLFRPTSWNPIRFEGYNCSAPLQDNLGFKNI